jgi:hypothetical protein
MDHNLRFVFHGAAAAFGGRIGCPPHDTLLETAASAALTVSGGRSRGAERRVAFGEPLRIGAAAASAEGLIDHGRPTGTRGRARATAPPGGSARSFTTTTVVSAEVRDVTLAVGPTIRAKQVRAALTARSPLASGQPSIVLGAETSFDGISIGRARLKVDVNRTLFERFDTHAKLLAACDDPRFVREHGGCLFLGEGQSQAAAPYGPGLSACPPIRGTIVRALSWEGPPPPNARIEGHTVVLGDTCTVVFGEILITAASRRLTMIRVECDCEPCGMVVFADVQDNGSWSS